MERHQAEPPGGTARRQLRILHVSDVYLPRTGGIEHHVSDLAARQRAAGLDVEIATLTPDPTCRDGQLPVHRPDRRWRSRAPWALMSSVIPDGRFDVVHAHVSAVSPLAVLAARAAASAPQPIPTVVTVHSLWRGYTAAYRAADIVARWSRWPIAWSAVSNAAADSVRAAASRPLDVTVLPNGIDPAAWAVPAPPGRVGHVRVASVLRFVARKRPMPLLRMLRQLRQRIPPSIELSAVLVGDGPARPAMQRYLKRHAMGWVELPGLLSREQVAEQLAGADVYTAPAVLESFGIAALEARLVGLPVVARRGTGVADFVVDGRDGWLCDSDSQMVDALVGVVDRHTRRSAHRPIADIGELTWPVVVRRTDELYARAAELLNVGRTLPTVTTAAKRDDRTLIAS